MGINFINSKVNIMTMRTNGMNVVSYSYIMRMVAYGMVWFPNVTLCEWLPMVCVWLSSVTL